MRLLLLFAGILLAVPLPAARADLQAQAEALRIIADTAARLCNNIDLRGDSTTFKLTGAANAEVTELIKSLVDLGIEGTGEIDRSEYTGLLQSDLGKLVVSNPAIIDQSACRVSVFDKLRGDLLPSSDSFDINRRILLYFANNPTVDVTKAAFELGVQEDPFRQRVESLEEQGYLSGTFLRNGELIASWPDEITCEAHAIESCRVVRYRRKLTEAGLRALSNPSLLIGIQ